MTDTATLSRDGQQLAARLNRVNQLIAGYKAMAEIAAAYRMEYECERLPEQIAEWEGEAAVIRIELETCYGYVPS
jgi:hypothetical protein